MLPARGRPAAGLCCCLLIVFMSHRVSSPIATIICIMMLSESRYALDRVAAIGAGVFASRHVCAVADCRKIPIKIADIARALVKKTSLDDLAQTRLIVSNRINWPLGSGQIKLCCSQGGSSMEKTPLRQLLSGDLPKMVQWFRLGLLARIWVRTIISEVFGQYADQRLLQAATDKVDKDTLVSLYDFSDLSSADQAKRLNTDATGGVWLDYIADTGDGFESTYAMSYMLSLEQLDVKDAGKLPRGEIVIFGGDEAYPQATRETYEKRLVQPLSWAHSTRHNIRKAFAIPGNHDWYDGLVAFDGLFCTARGDLSDGQGTNIGGWNFRQHRSYWALKLPYDWWIWGGDIQFSKYLDSAQVNYFEAIADQMVPNDNLIICLAEPAWLLADQQGIDPEENLFKLVTLAHSRGVNVCAVVAGDWHHYNRYHASELGTHFFTAGGGGAFLHGTHVLKDDISITWPERPEEDSRDVMTAGGKNVPAAVAPAGNGVGAKGEPWRARKVGMNLRNRRRDLPGQQMQMPRGRTPADAAGDAVNPATAPAAPATGATGGGTAGRPDGAPAQMRVRTSQRAPKCYPSKRISRWLSLKNISFPLHNIGFAAGIGVIYWLLTWAFHVVAKSVDFVEVGEINAVTLFPQHLSADYLATWAPTYWDTWKYMMLQVVKALLVGPEFLFPFAALAAVLIWYVHATNKRGLRRWFVKGTVGFAHFMVHVIAMFSLFLMLMAANNWIEPKITPWISAGLQQPAANANFLRRFVHQLLAPLSKEGEQQRQMKAQVEQGTYDTRSLVAPDAPLPDLSLLPKTIEEVDPLAVSNLVGLLYPFEMIFLGGLIGGCIWGLYWVLTGLLGKMHTEDAFAALAIKNYKNFLRMRFDPDKLTIYPIGLDKVPGKSGWTNAPKEGSAFVNQPRLIASPPLRPELIEEPIVIYASRKSSDNAP